jgi:hypothetical protein
MVPNAFIPAGAEVFNTYGPALDNAQLICHYGFALDGNEHDVVSWDAAELDDTLPGSLHDKQRCYAAYLREWQARSWDESDVVFVIDRSESSPVRSYLVNADGCISHELWIWAAAAALAHEPRISTDTDVILAVTNLADEQIRLEAQMEADGAMDEDDGRLPEALGESPSDPTTIARLLKLLEVLGSIIEARQSKLKRGKSQREIESLLDVSSSLWCTPPEAHARSLSRICHRRTSAHDWL